MEDGWLTQGFEENRSHLKGIAYRMLGSMAEADDAVQEAWLRLNRSEPGDIANLGGWLTTVVARICLDMLRARKVRPTAPQDADALADLPAAGAGPEEELLLADSMGPALTVVLDLLAPAERVAFVLHDLFAIPFEEVAAILGRTPEATRQLASRGRRRIQGRGEAVPEADKARRQRIVDAFLQASRNGDFQALLAALDPDVVLRADDMAVRTAAANQRTGAPILAAEIRGAKAVAETFKGRARGAMPALIDGLPGAVWVDKGQVRCAFVFGVRGDRISGIDFVMEPEGLGTLKVEILAERRPRGRE
ncbi:MAG TPA: sigma-70 family RNA polymerase sigma factor [Fibrobacteria bacterium]|nr:sigma-70 family RNA polymerase sigma factor [Fibrobacteria bacterium]